LGTDSTCGIGKSWGSTPGSSCVNAKPARSRRLSTQLASAFVALRRDVSLARPRASFATLTSSRRGRYRSQVSLPLGQAKGLTTFEQATIQRNRILLSPEVITVPA